MSDAGITGTLTALYDKGVAAGRAMERELKGTRNGSLSEHYNIVTYADGFGIWHARVDFLQPMGNSGVAEKIVYAAMENAKRCIRNELKARQDAPLRRTYYEVTDNKIDHMNHLWSITLGEK